MCSAVIIYYFGKIFFPIKRKQGVNNCFKSLISSVFTTVKIISKREREREGERGRESEGEGEGQGERVFWNYFNANSRVPWQQKIYIITLKTQQRVPV